MLSQASWCAHVRQLDGGSTHLLDDADHVLGDRQIQRRANRAETAACTVHPDHARVREANLRRRRLVHHEEALFADVCDDPFAGPLRIHPFHEPDVD